MAHAKVVAGVVVSLRANPKIKGKVCRIYPFEDKPNIMVKWEHGSIKSYFLKELRT